MSKGAAIRISAIFGFLGVSLGAFGAHGLEKRLAELGTTATWDTAVLYHLIHAAVLLAVAYREPLSKTAWTLFALGILIFSGTLYILSLTGIKWLGAITPIGGICFLAAWLMLAIRPR